MAIGACGAGDTRILIIFHRERIAKKDTFAIIGIGIKVVASCAFCTGNELARRQQSQAIELLRGVGDAHDEAHVLEPHVSAFWPSHRVAGKKPEHH